MCENKQKVSWIIWGLISFLAQPFKNIKCHVTLLDFPLRRYLELEFSVLGRHALVVVQTNTTSSAGTNSMLQAISKIWNWDSVFPMYRFLLLFVRAIFQKIYECKKQNLKKQVKLYYSIKWGVGSIKFKVYCPIRE